MQSKHTTSPLFSIITITYNAERWLEQTILSVLSQSYAGIEYIVIDGGSTDGTVEIIRRYASGITYWVSEPDKGIYDAMNKGIQRATGDYVWFINAGDSFYAANTVQQVATLIEGKKRWPDILYGETDIVDEAGRSLGLRRLRTPKRLSWKRFRMGMLVCHQSFVVKRAIVPMYDLQYRYSADFDWCIRVMKQSHTLHNTHLVLIDYLNEGMTTRNHRASLRERFRIMCRHYGYVRTVLLHFKFALRLLYKK